MVDEIPKLNPDLFQLGGVERVNKVVPKPEERERSSEPDDEGLLQERGAMGKRKKPPESALSESQASAGAKPAVPPNGEETAEKQEGATKHVDVVV
jgi:hypothetical protein